jgi:hypothetical protein
MVGHEAALVPPQSNLPHVTNTSQIQLKSAQAGGRSVREETGQRIDARSI